MAIAVPLGPVSGPLIGAGPAQADTIPITRSLLQRLKRRSERGRRSYRGDEVYVKAAWKDLDKAVQEDGAKLDLRLIESVRVRKKLGHYGSEEKAARILEDYGDEIAAAREATGVEAHLIVTVIGIESNGHSKAVSPVGAQGLMQLMPGTAKRFGVEDSFDPGQNIMGGAKYLAFLMRHFEGDHVRVLAGYNAGEHRVEEYNGVPPFLETQGYLIKAAAFIDDAEAATRSGGANSTAPRARPEDLSDATPDESAALSAPPVITQDVSVSDQWMSPLE